MEVTGTISNLDMDYETGKPKLTLLINEKQSLIKAYDKLKPVTLDITIKHHRKKRSLDANAYAWVLMSKLAQVLNIPKTEVYRQYIKEIGCYEPMPIKDERVGDFEKIWGSKGTGWVLEVIDDSKLKGYKLCHAYYGSSAYDTKQMSRLIDLIVEDCKLQEIETLTPSEIAKIKAQWG